MAAGAYSSSVEESDHKDGIKEVMVEIKGGFVENNYQFN